MKKHIKITMFTLLGLTLYGQTEIEINSNAGLAIYSFLTNKKTRACPVPPQVIPIPLPNFTISMQNSTGQTINTFTFSTNSNFKSRLAILTVQIFPPTNMITTVNSNTAIVPAGNENSYGLIYTLQSPDGLYFQQEVQYPTNFSLTTYMPIVNGFPTFPTNITIKTPSATLISAPIVASLATIPATTISATQSQILTQQQLFNSISPITQKFLITTNNLGTNVQATAMSGSYDPNSNASTIPLLTALIPSTVSVVPPINPTTNPNTQSPIPPMPLTVFNGSVPYTLQLLQSAASFQLNEQDLLNGIIIHLFLYPPLYQNGLTPVSNSFTVIATLQTTDGLKFSKIIKQNVNFAYYPTMFNLIATTLEGFQTTFTSNMANSLLTNLIFTNTLSPQIYNMLSPLNIALFLQQNDNYQVAISVF